MASTSASKPGALRLDVAGIHIFNVDPRSRVDAGVREGFGEGLVGFRQTDVFAHHGDGDFMLGFAAVRQHPLPLGHVRRTGLDAQLVGDYRIDFFLHIQRRDAVDVIDIGAGDDRPFFDVGEQGDLAARI